jgi:two-component system, cell cycle response regulator DivK
MKAKERSSSARVRRPTVMVVDDYTDNREMYGEYLVHKGLRVIEAGSGGEALELAFAHRPDVIVMDLSLPGMDGWEATRLLKGDPRTKGIPIVVVTGHALAGDAQRAEAAGCDDFLTKPCLPRHLYERLTKILEPARAKGSRAT